MTTLTHRQRDVLAAILDLQDADTVVTTSGLAETLGMPRQNARTYALALLEAGLVTYEPSDRHTTIIRATPQGWAHLNRSSPGRHRPMSPRDHQAANAVALGDVLEVEPGDYVMRVGDDLCGNQDLRPGDHVIVRPSVQTPDPGRLVLVRLAGQRARTLTRWIDQGSTIPMGGRSRPPGTPALEQSVEGHVIGIIRSMRA